MRYEYAKMTGSGNDFILIDNFSLKYSPEEVRKITPKLCSRGLSLGADGVIMIEPVKDADFKWHFFNADGSIASMCGNGSRCAARFAYLKGHTDKTMKMLTGAGVINAEIKENARVNVQLTKPHSMKIDNALKNAHYKTYSFINTGVPHAVFFEDDIDSIDVFNIGRQIRNHDEFAPEGTNVNFIKVIKDGLRVRTYERGVENETLACGTGSVASALIAIEKGAVQSPVKILTTGGIDLLITKDGEDVYLEGEARFLCEGVIEEEAYKY